MTDRLELHITALRIGLLYSDKSTHQWWIQGGGGGSTRDLCLCQPTIQETMAKEADEKSLWLVPWISHCTPFSVVVCEDFLVICFDIYRFWWTASVLLRRQVFSIVYRVHHQILTFTLHMLTIALKFPSQTTVQQFNSQVSYILQDSKAKNH